MTYRCLWCVPPAQIAARKAAEEKAATDAIAAKKAAEQKAAADALKAKADAADDELRAASLAHDYARIDESMARFELYSATAQGRPSRAGYAPDLREQTPPSRE